MYTYVQNINNYGFCGHFNSLRFGKSQKKASMIAKEHINDASAARGVILFVSSEILKRRLSKLLLDHPMTDVSPQTVCDSLHSNRARQQHQTTMSAPRVTQALKDKCSPVSEAQMAQTNI